MKLGRSASAFVALAATALNSIGGAHGVERQDNRRVEAERNGICLALKSNPDLLVESQHIRQMRIADHIRDVAQEIHKLGDEFRMGKNSSLISDELVTIKFEIERSIKVIELFEENNRLQNEVDANCRE